MLAVLIPLILPIVGKLIDGISGNFRDDADREKAKAEAERAVLQALTQLDLSQFEINKIDAQSGKWYQAGWRPALGWVCVLGLTYEWILMSLFNGLLVAFGEYDFSLPGLEIENLITILVGMLGLAGYRTYEKVKSQ